MHAPVFDHRRSALQGITSVLMLVMLLASTARAEVFWSVSDECGRQNWLLGTLHSEDARLLEWRRPLVDALQKAERLAVELVPDAATLDQLTESMRTDDASLPAHLGPDLYRRVAERLTTDYGFSSSAVASMAPWAVALTLATEPPKTGLYMDLMLANRARGAGLEVLALETMQEQVELLSGLTLEQQIRLIRSAIDQTDRSAPALEAIVTAYLDGDLDRLKSLTEDQMADLGAGMLRYFDEQGLAERNRRMIERAEPWLAEGGLIIAVGALHLQGEQGLVAELRRRGWQVKGIY
jgi:uncharacterized protein YbaP (TraB family)